VLGAGWTEVVALAAAFVIAVLATSAGISGAVLLPPFQVSVLGTPSPAVTPTNLLYNVVATQAPCTGTGGRASPAPAHHRLVDGSSRYERCTPWTRPVRAPAEE
jgi:hypothetical protein